MKFLMNEKTQRYQDLYNKFYIGYLNIEDSKKLLQLNSEYSSEQKVVVAIEKKFTDEIVVTYYLQKTRKNLILYSLDANNKLVKEKKDPYGITVTEVFHISKQMDESYLLTPFHIKTIKKLLKDDFKKRTITTIRKP